MNEKITQSPQEFMEDWVASIENDAPIVPISVIPKYLVFTDRDAWWIVQQWKPREFSYKYVSSFRSESEAYSFIKHLENKHR